MSKNPVLSFFDKDQTRYVCANKGFPRGCTAKTFLPEENGDDVCHYHPGEHLSNYSRWGLNYFYKLNAVKSFAPRFFLWSRCHHRLFPPWWTIHAYLSEDQDFHPLAQIIDEIAPVFWSPFSDRRKPWQLCATRSNRRVRKRQRPSGGREPEVREKNFEMNIPNYLTFLGF